MTMDAFDELKARYIGGEAVTELEFALLFGSKALSVKTANEAAAELARLQAVEKERDALREYVINLRAKMDEIYLSGDDSTPFKIAKRVWALMPELTRQADRAALERK